MKNQIVIVILSLLFQVGYAQEKVEYDHIPQDLVPYFCANFKDVKWFIDAKFGVFIQVETKFHLLKHEYNN